MQMAELAVMRYRITTEFPCTKIFGKHEGKSITSSDIGDIDTVRETKVRIFDNILRVNSENFLHFVG